MHKRFDPRRPYFAGVAMAIIVAGAGLFALSLAELAANVWGDWSFGNLFAKAAGGLVVIALGYVHLELELIRVSRGTL